MSDETRIVDLEAVPENGSYRFTAEDPFTNETELILVRCAEEPGVRAWSNTCPHESQRLDTGDGAAMRDDAIVCPRHGSHFDACSGACEDGPAAGTTLPGVELAVEDGTVHLADDRYTFLHEGGVDDDEPGSTSHLSL
ncbi:Ferredoxin subunit of nitrite reductase or a ring-hydroxylating dioxygenase [Halorubrum aquaticum]|uniref:Ferredoxin subunit of nitrite reductase or a ring-hydroxylating dioxygenase n=1 Tax=Halorubrum aquaticum TaxID=387340 RepID=A0A1I2ZKF2_9EURY|nr:Rieske 2Fe-2S domain-containing protein [Halorubrum aquaticum]SFH38293.1 Ferredoxin subunit of nitrite reductase or a ring-hydroxylating dioxygenase [Halorubrum aquaticum]